MRLESPWSRDHVLVVLVGATVLSGTLLIPAVRPIVATLHDGSDGLAHAFMSVNMLGAAIGAPLMAALADRTGMRRGLAIGAALMDGLLLFACALPVPAAALLGIRALQGALNLGVLSVLMGALRSDPGPASDRALGMAGAATMLAVALGAPLGTLALRAGVLAPLLVAGMLPLAVAASLLGLALDDVRPSSAPGAVAHARLAPWRAAPALRGPVVWVAVERFAVGSLVVSFSLFARRVHDLDDVSIGSLFSWFLVPFVLITYPATRAAAVVGDTPLVSLGLAGYGLSFALLGLVPAWALPWAMLAAGVSSAAVYGPALRAAARAAPPGGRAGAMALLNAGGALGMLAGTAAAGIASAALAHVGWGADRAYPAIFGAVGAVQWLALALTWGRGSVPAPLPVVPGGGLGVPRAS